MKDDIFYKGNKPTVFNPLLQISMNVQALKQTSVIPTLCVATLLNPTSVVASLDIRVMVETVQVIEI